MDHTSPGLMLEDVQRKECLSIVEHLAGESNGNIDDLFEVADTNGDGIVMRSEVSEAFQFLSLLRSNSEPKPECKMSTQNQYGAKFYGYGCNNYYKDCCSGKCSEECKCPMDC